MIVNMIVNMIVQSHKLWKLFFKKRTEVLIKSLHLFDAVIIFLFN